MIFNRAGTAIGNIAFMEWEYADLQVYLAERCVIVALLAIAATLFVYPTTVAAVILGSAVLLETTAVYHFEGTLFSDWSHPALAMRFLAPFALIPLIAMPKKEPQAAWRYEMCGWIMRVGVASVFIAHGLEALYRHPQFIDLIIGSTRRWIGYRPTESQAIAVLVPIGIMDVIVGVLLLCGRWRPLLCEMAFWGFITAMSRVTANGPLSYPEVLMRASHFLIPLAILQIGPALDAAKARRRASEEGAPEGSGAELSPAT